MINQWKGTATVCLEETTTVTSQLPGNGFNVTCVELPDPLANVCLAATGGSGYFPVYPDGNRTVAIPVPVPCTFPDGDAVLEFFGLDAVMLLPLFFITYIALMTLMPSLQDNMAFDIGMLIALMAAFRICAYLSLLARTYRK